MRFFLLLAVALIVSAQTPRSKVSAGELKPGLVLASDIPGTEVSMPWAYVAPGSFDMGCAQGDMECYDIEKPRHRVTLSKPFWMMTTELAVASWERYRKANAKSELPRQLGRWTGLNTAGMTTNVAVGMTWQEASDVCEWLGGRLPTEAEWEFAARAGDAGALPKEWWRYAWYADNGGNQNIDFWDILLKNPDDMDRIFQRMVENQNRPHLVGNLRANAWNLKDMLGNAWEWVADSQRKYGAAVSNPKGQAGPKRGIRGGSYLNLIREIRYSLRGEEEVGARAAAIGCRCVRDTQP